MVKNFSIKTLQTVTSSEPYMAVLMLRFGFDIEYPDTYVCQGLRFLKL
jgi:hypothetical protein